MGGGGGEIKEIVLVVWSVGREGGRGVCSNEVYLEEAKMYELTHSK